MQLTVFVHELVLIFPLKNFYSAPLEDLAQIHISSID